MHIKKMCLKNFRCFEEQEIRFNNRFNLIVGDNGFGKTTILEALTVGISSFLNDIKSLDPNDKRNIRNEDVRIKRNDIGELTEFHQKYPVELEFTVELYGDSYNYKRILENKARRTTFDEQSRIKKASNCANVILEAGKKEILPAFAYHGTGWVWAKASQSSRKESEVNNRIFGYQNCLNPKSNEYQYMVWIKRMRQYEIDENKESVELKTLYRAAEKFLGEGTKVAYKVKEDMIIITLPNGQIMPYDRLSDGYKNALGVVFDTAFRMIKLNPWLKEEAIEETPGIILIDEIDLHLHPSWQKRIVNDIKVTFPKMQIIATTHAPIVISSCNKDELIILSSGINEQLENYVTVKYAESSTKGWLTENILNEIMNVETSRENETENIIKRFRKLYEKKFQEGFTGEEREEFEKLKQKLDQGLPAEDPVVTMIGLESFEKGLEDK